MTVRDLAWRHKQHDALMILSVWASVLTMVILPALTFVSTCLAVQEVGATPILVDVDPQTRNIDTGALKNSITKKQKPYWLCTSTADRAIWLVLRD